MRPALGAVLEYSKDNVDLVSAQDGSVLQRLVADQTYLHVGGSLVLVDRIRIGASLPLALEQYGFRSAIQPVGSPQAPQEAAVGDLRVGADLRLFGVYGDPFQVAIGGQVWLPTGLAHEYTGDGKVRGAPHLIISGDVLDIAYSIRGGYEARGLKQTFDGVSFGNELTGGLALGLRLVDKKLLIGPELTIWTLATSAFKNNTSPAEALLGAHYTAGDFKIGAGVGASMTQAYGAPGFRGTLGLDWIPAIGAAPTVRSRPRRHRRHRGRLPRRPRRPDQRPQDQRVSASAAGRPLDTDGDGIPDELDACPTVPGVKTDDPKTNGCPPDRDHDGIFDSEDACPDVPGVKTDDPKTNGCPSDRDHDGILDDVDACPDEPGPPNSDPKKNGCPMAFVSNGQIKITEQVKFAVGSAKILTDSDQLLGVVVKVLTDHAEIKSVRVEGHTDNRGAAAMNKKLSAQRAAAVAAWLTAHGIDKGRLTSEGFGMERPIDTNDTPEGRQNNRRVEFHIAGGEGMPASPAPAPKH